MLNYLFQNDQGLKPAEAALVSGKRSSAELLLTYQTSLALTRDLLTRERSHEALTSDNQEIRTQFRYTYSNRIAGLSSGINILIG